MKNLKLEDRISANYALLFFFKIFISPKIFIPKNKKLFEYR